MRSSQIGSPQSRRQAVRGIAGDPHSLGFIADHLHGEYGSENLFLCDAHVVPDIGDFKEVEVIEVLVKPGDAVSKEQSLITL